MQQQYVRDLRALSALVVALAAVVIPNAHSWSGPVLLTLSETHGVHLSDLGVVAVALAVAVFALQRGVPPVGMLLGLRPATQPATA